jgi:hypothetical protein
MMPFSMAKANSPKIQKPRPHGVGLEQLQQMEKIDPLYKGIGG